MAACSPLSVASFAGSVCAAMATAAGDGPAIIEGAASRSASSNLGMFESSVCPSAHFDLSFSSASFAIASSCSDAFVHHFTASL